MNFPKLYSHFIPVERKSTRAPFSPPGPNDWRRPSLAWHAESGRGESMCCRQSATVLLGKALVPLGAPPSQRPPSSPTERKYQRVLLKQCVYNWRGVQAFETATSSVSQELFSKRSLNTLYKKTLSLLRLSQQKIVQKPLFASLISFFFPLLILCFFCF